VAVGFVETSAKATGWPSLADHADVQRRCGYPRRAAGLRAILQVALGVARVLARD
jgi:hypothetical protein